MPIASISILRHRTIIPTTAATTLPTVAKLIRQISTLRCFSVAAAKQQHNPNVSRKSQPPSKKLLRAKQTVKDYSSLAPVLSPEDKPPLSESKSVGTVAAAQANFMRVIVEPPRSFDESKVELLCVVKAVLKKIKRRVLVGDKVLVGSIDWVDRRGMIENVYQRSSEILDPPVANVDHLLVLFSMDQPKLEPFALTRFLIEAESTGIPLTLALNKSELVDEEAMVAWKSRLHKWGYKPIFCSVESKYGLDSLAFILRDQTSVIVGPSGVGKSSLINALRNNHNASDAAEGENLFDPILGSKWFEDQLVGQVSTRSGRGKHTTRNVSLLPLSAGGYLADTPGFNQPSLMKVTKQSLAQAFPEIRQKLSDSEPAKCSFNDCLHLGEPGCIVKADWERYPYYFQLLDEIRIREEFQLRTFGTKKEGDVRYKMGDKGVQQAEPRLELKKHRRVSRKSMNQSLLDELDELDDDDNLLDECPGQAVCKRLFERRGFHVNRLWQTKILQAADTDISALVEIEKNSPHRFEFFMGLSGDQPICARTAWAYGNAGGRISHALSVYSCQLRQPNQVKTIFEFLNNGFHEISSSLDLSFEDDAVADEKIPFLAYLSSVLKGSSFGTYEPPAGSKHFRNLIAGFMKTYHRIPLKADNVVVFPSRAVAIENALRLFSPRLAIVDEHLTRHLPRNWLTSLAIEGAGTDNPSEDSLTVIEAPRQSDLMIELIRKLKPQVVVTGIAEYEAVTSSAFVHLLDVTREIGSRLFLDISDQFELSSLPGSNGVLKYIGGTTLPSHAAIICGLVKNKVYSDLEVAFVISEEESIFKALSKTVELLEGNTAPISQCYYGCLFHELLAFQLADRHPPAQREIASTKSAEMIGFASSAISVLNNAELSISEAGNSSLIHMDVDQSFLRVPSPVKAAIFESFARQNIAESEIDVTTSIKQFIKSTYGYPVDSSTEFIYADSSLALFNKLVVCCIQEGGTLCFPAGSNGNYVSAAKFLKANIVTIPTKPADGFKLTDMLLSGELETVNKPWVYISGPTINPTGLIYSNKEIESLLSICAKVGARVVIDTSFSGLEFDFEGWGGWNLVDSLSKLNSSNPSFCVSLLGGLSLKMLSGALKFGFLVLNQSVLVETFYSFPGLSKPHNTVKYAIKKLLSLREQKPGDLWDAIAEHIKNLKSRSKRLKETLEKCGWDVLEPCGGVSMVAKPSSYLNKSVKFKKSPNDGGCTQNETMSEVKLDDSNIREVIHKATGLCINSGSWTGIPGYCRFTIALEESEFERALDCIVKFKDTIKN